MELEYGKYFHIYNRGNNRENLFYEERNYDYFLKQYMKHIVPVAETFAYCLMKNHFHLMVRIKDEDTMRLDNSERFDKSERFVKSRMVTNQFKNFFISYAKAINKAYGRTGALFQRPFGRREITTDEYFARLCIIFTLIHRNIGLLKISGRTLIHRILLFSLDNRVLLKETKYWNGLAE